MSKRKHPNAPSRFMKLNAKLPDPFNGVPWTEMPGNDDEIKLFNFYLFKRGDLKLKSEVEAEPATPGARLASFATFGARSALLARQRAEHARKELDAIELPKKVI